MDCVPSHFGQALVVGWGGCGGRARYAPLGAMPWLQIGTPRIWPEAAHDCEMHPLRKKKCREQPHLKRSRRKPRREASALRRATRRERGKREVWLGNSDV